MLSSLVWRLATGIINSFPDSAWECPSGRAPLGVIKFFYLVGCEKIQNQIKWTLKIRSFDVINVIVIPQTPFKGGLLRKLFTKRPFDLKKLISD